MDPECGELEPGRARPHGLRVKAEAEARREARHRAHVDRLLAQLGHEGDVLGALKELKRRRRG